MAHEHRQAEARFLEREERLVFDRAQARGAPGAPEQIYTVAAGDSLSKISKKVYGDANQWKRIFEANRDQIKNPDLIHPGQKLKIPAKLNDVEGGLKSKESRMPLYA